MTLDPLPFRVVDADHQGWYLSGDDLYHADYGPARGLEPCTLEDLTAKRGPLRPVLAVCDADDHAVRTALGAARHKAAGSVAVALYQLFRARIGDDTARRQLLAGREGSWESAGLSRIAWEIGSRIAEKPSRYNEDTVRTLVTVIEWWVTDPERYTEVAETLAHLFAQVADQADGWTAVADRPLHPDGRMPQTGADTLYAYLMSTAGTFDPGMLR